MRVFKQISGRHVEYTVLFLVYLILITNYWLNNDSVIALLSAFFGITYTALAGKGKPVCYLFGVSGSGLYSYLAFSNALWGNLLLYMCYYIPMQVIGFFQWNKNLKKHKNEIIKTSLSAKDACLILIISTVFSIAAIFILHYLGDTNPVIDGVTTILSIVGMYLTVKRCIEQWIAWMIVNILSLIMWLNIALSGEKVFSTVIMWGVYFLLAIYFYITWRKELKKTTLES